ncbi:tetratricopeptide repeat-containing sulfotransferase family protein [Dokdonella fugitiva]|uniref:Tfp pilus assembly protein PilF n=1 Tax=Dokdonella fugitiva TaxID=328517 RepID=A0A4R2IDV2_9GAMM|nr:tetratricopeptide repeat-containing sulfotransferase family protein [Dokdonella fugitiva]TCO42774.1 Tfp pilus assembly protein PilF [Dokdonella fugitiva]
MATTPSLPSRLQGLTPRAVQQVVATAQALEAGRVDEAEAQIGAAIAAFPHQAEVLRLWAGIRSQRGDHEAAIRAIRAAVAQRPADALYLNTLGTVLAEAGDYDGAIAALRRCCELQPGLALAWFNLGVLLTRCVRHEEAVTALRRAVELAPSHVQARALLADMLRVANHPTEAAAEYRRILAERPCTGIAWWGLADIRTSRFEAGDVARMQAALRDAHASEDDIVATGFALAKAFDERGEYAASLAALEQANAVARRRRRWDAAGFDAFMASIRDAYAALADAEDSPQDEAFGQEAIFITSLPRSGSTLIEQILASHPAVEGAGELADLPLLIAGESRRRQQPYPRWVGAMRADDWRRLGQAYLDRTAHWRRRRALFTDKLPNNWYYIDAIRRMLPGARIIAVRRDPLETCFSCYRQFLYNNEYTRSFADLAGFWRAFDRATRDALARHPGHVHESVYEDLLAQPEQRIRSLLDFLGLSFEPSCLEFHRTERDVRSPSAMQVREPLRHDTARSDRYGALLDPLRAALS